MYFMMKNQKDQSLWIVIILIIVVAVVAMLALLSLSLDSTPMWDFDGHMDYPGAWAMGLGMGIPLLAILIVVLFILWMDSSRGRGEEYDRSRREGSFFDTKEARDILAERYARGEISREEYLRMLEDIRDR